MDDAKRPRRVLLVGWDAADWRMIDPMIEAGEMPNLARFVREGVRGNVATLQPPLSPMLWTSVATGKLADKHGVLGFAESDGLGGARPVTSTGRSCKALWNILWDLGRPAGAVNWYASHPAERTPEGVDGFVVTDRFAPAVGPLERGEPHQGWAPVRGSVWPEGDLETLASVRVHPGMIGPEQIEAFIPGAAGQPEATREKVGELRTLLAHCATVHNAATAYFGERDWEFFGIYYDAIDRFAHAFMEYGEPRMEHVSEADFGRYRGVMHACYRYHDLMLGRLMNLLDDETAVVLLSDHGFHSGESRPRGTSGIADGNPAAWHRAYGVIAFWGPGIRAGGRVHGATLLDVAPTVLSMLGIPPARDMDGQPLTQIWESPSLELERVETYEVGGARLFADEDSDSGVERRVMRQLQDLGYLGSSGEAEIEFDRQRNLATVYASSGRMAQAQREYERMLSARPEDRGARFGLASAHLAFGRLDEAWAVADSLEIDDPAQRARVLMLRASVLQSRGESERALGLLREALALDGTIAGIESRIGALEAGMGRFDAAERALDSALARDPDDAEALDVLGVVYRVTGRAAESVYSHMQSIALVRQRGRSHLNLALALIDSDRIGWAMEALGEAATLMPLSPEPHDALARLYGERLDNAGKASFHTRRATEIRGLLARGPVDVRAASDGGGVAAARDDGRSVVVVSGLPRSGTSLMMRAIEAGGGGVLVDGERTADADNPLGYYELEAVKRTAEDASWLAGAPGRAVKLVHALLRVLPGDLRYDVVFMKRDLDEVVASQAAMLDRLGRGGGGLEPAVLKDAYAREYERTGAWLSSQDRFRVLEVSYNRFVASPGVVAAEVAAFLGEGRSGMRLDAGAMAACVDPALYRQRGTRSAT